MIMRKPVLGLFGAFETGLTQTGCNTIEDDYRPERSIKFMYMHSAGILPPLKP